MAVTQVLKWALRDIINPGKSDSNLVPRLFICFISAIAFFDTIQRKTLLFLLFVLKLTVTSSDLIFHK